jgi:radical SAM protein with 4Fe4S-binding SPASM domain
MGIVGTAFWNGLGKVFGGTVSYGLRMVSGNSPTALPKRSTRVWRVARGMIRGDLTGAHPVRLQVETTDICNLKCRMCAREALDGMDSTTMTLDAFTKLVDEVNPFYVTMNGLGEPLIDKTIFDKLDVLHDRGIYSSMPTNSTFVDGPRLTKLLSSFPSVLTLSIDGATKESFEYVRRLANFDKTIANARKLITRRAAGEGRQGELRLLCALQKANLFDFKEMFALVRSLGAKHFNLAPVFDYEPEGSLYSELIPSKDDVERLLPAIDGHLTTVSDPEETSFMMKWREAATVWLKDHRIIPSENKHACTVPWFSTYVDAKGRVYPCCYLLTSEHVMGNVTDAPFNQVWNGASYRKFRERLMSDRPHLSGCNVCPRNDDSLLATLRKYRLLLFAGRQEPVVATSRPRLVKLPVLS